MAISAIILNDPKAFHMDLWRNNPTDSVKLTCLLARITLFEQLNQGHWDRMHSPEALLTPFTSTDAASMLSMDELDGTLSTFFVQHDRDELIERNDTISFSKFTIGEIFREIELVKQLSSAHANDAFVATEFSLKATGTECFEADPQPTIERYSETAHVELVKTASCFAMMRVGSEEALIKDSLALCRSFRPSQVRRRVSEHLDNQQDRRVAYPYFDTTLQSQLDRIKISSEGSLAAFATEAAVFNEVGTDALVTHHFAKKLLEYMHHHVPEERRRLPMPSQEVPFVDRLLGSAFVKTVLPFVKRG